MKYIFILFFIISSCNDKKELQKSNTNIAKEDFELGDYYARRLVVDSALSYYIKAKDIYINLNDEVNTGMSLYNISRVYYMNGDFVRAKITALKAAYILNKEPDPNEENMYKVCNMLGIICKDLKEYDKSIEYYNKALEFTENTPLYKSLAFNNLGVTYQNINKNEEAINYFKKGLNFPNLYKNMPVTYSMLQDNLAYSKLKLKQYSELPSLFYKALAIRDSLQIVPGIVINKLHLSDYYEDQKDNHKAIQFAKEAYVTAKEKGVDPEDILRCLKRLITVDSTNKIAYMSEYVKISDDLKETRPKLQSKIAQAELEKEELSLKNKQLKNAVVISVIVILLLVIIFLIKNYRLKNIELKLAEDRILKDEYEYKMHEKLHSFLLDEANKSRNKLSEEKALVSDKLLKDLLNKLLDVRVSLDASKERTDPISAVDRHYDIKELEDIEASLMDIYDILKVKETGESFSTILNDLFLKHDDLEIKFNVGKEIKWMDMTSHIKVCFYNIIEEAINNIVKHSKAKEVYGGFLVQDNNLILTIVDDGIGFDTRKTKDGEGIKIMRFAAEMMGGTFEIKSSKIGTTINVKTNI